MTTGKYKRSKSELKRLRDMNLCKKGKNYEEIYGKEKAKLIIAKKSGSNTKKWKGGIKIDSEGYILVD